MKNWLIGFAVILMVISGFLYFYFQPVSLRYKLTLKVENNGVPVSGSSVIEVKYRREPQLFGIQGRGSSSVRGEAVVVDLGERGVAFALLKEAGFRSDPTWIAIHHFNADKNYTDYGRQLQNYKTLGRQVGRKVELKPEDLPLIVTFSDLNDPLTVKLVHQAALCEQRLERGGVERYGCVKTDNFAQVFGRDVRLVGASLEITDEPVTSGIERWLPWINEYYGKRLDGDRFGYAHAKKPLANSLSAGSFATHKKE